LKAFEDGGTRDRDGGEAYIPGINDMDQVETVAGVITWGTSPG
jgi:hypothetical protein